MQPQLSKIQLFEPLDYLTISLQTLHKQIQQYVILIMQALNYLSISVGSQLVWIIEVIINAPAFIFLKSLYPIRLIETGIHSSEVFIPLYHVHTC